MTVLEVLGTGASMLGRHRNAVVWQRVAVPKRRIFSKERPMLQMIHKGVRIHVHLWQVDDENWTGKCILIRPDQTTQEFVPKNRIFTTRELAREAAIEEARQYIDRPPALAQTT
jgi:hypothetical protein